MHLIILLKDKVLDIEIFIINAEVEMQLAFFPLHTVS